MFKDLLAAMHKEFSSSQEELNDSLLRRTDLEFKPIQCPKSCQPLSSKECQICSHKKEYRRSHQSGSNLITIICDWNAEIEG
ncbi:MAG TPA: hypothetical protein VMX55_11450 [candidate division Zixibacteria bacterium]|nr:hypothetical protein [candidate division Zixibacteria bacterium]